MLGATVALVGGIEIALFAADPTGPTWPAAAITVVGWVYVAAGWIAWRRRPGNRIGALLVLGGIAWLAAALVNTDTRALVAVGEIMATAPLAVLVHLLHAFPSGRVREPGPRLTVAAGYVVAVVLQAPQYLFAADAAPADLLQIADSPGLVAAAVWVQKAAGAAVVLVTALILARRLAVADPARRRVLLPLFSCGMVAVLAIPVAADLVGPLAGLSPEALLVVQLAAIVVVPVAFVLGVLRGGFARTGEIEELGAWLGTGRGGAPPLRAALASTLGDPSLRLVFWGPARETYLDADGRAAELPVETSGRAVTEVELAGRRVGAIDYDATLIADPELVRAAAQVVALAVDRDRLTAELLASEDALRASRSRIVEAGDEERRRITRNLHDGLQVQLVLLALDAQRLAVELDAGPVAREAAVALRRGIDDAAAGLRRLVYAVLPAPLVEGGLVAAAEDLVDRVPLATSLDLRISDSRLPPAIESTAYFVLAEGISNALKHSGARSLVIRLSHTSDHLVVEVADDGRGGAVTGRGSGLRGLADRIDVLGGRLHIQSTVGQGTVVKAELPCVS